jgi:hypothetical protein
MKRSSLGEVITSFPIAPGAPKSVTDAYEAFDEAGSRAAAVESELYTVTTEWPSKLAALREANAKARLTGSKSAGDPAVAQTAHEHEVADLEADLALARKMADEAGNRLIKAIGQERDAYYATAAASEAEAKAELSEALDAVGVALRKVALHGNARRWVRRLDLGAALHGGHGAFPGAAHMVRLSDKVRKVTDNAPGTLVSALREVVEPYRVYSGAVNGQRKFRTDETDQHGRPIEVTEDGAEIDV